MVEARRLIESASEIEVKENIPLAGFTSFGIGGPASLFMEVGSGEAVGDVFIRPEGLELWIQLARTVDRAVVDHDDLPLHAHIDRDNPREDFLQRLGFVENGNNDGKSHQGPVHLGRIKHREAPSDQILDIDQPDKPVLVVHHRQLVDPVLSHNLQGLRRPGVEVDSDHP